jgi:hypothetical protein
VRIEEAKERPELLVPADEAVRAHNHDSVLSRLYDWVARGPERRGSDGLEPATLRRDRPVVGGWNPRIDFLAESDPLVQAANAIMTSVAARARAVFADMVSVFNPQGEQPRIAAICMLTLLCSEGDVHPSHAGYQAMADVVFDVSGYVRLGGERRRPGRQHPFSLGQRSRNRGTR